MDQPQGQPAIPAPRLSEAWQKLDACEMTKSRGILAPRQYWTAEQLQILIDRYPHERAEDLAVILGRPKSGIFQKARKLGLEKSEEFKKSDLSGRIQRGKQDPRMVATRFPKGHVPANKGLRRPGYAPGGMAETQFKKGHRGGKALELYKPIGTERVSKDGYLERKINDDMPLQKRWRAVHLLLWEFIHGPVNGKTHAVIFRNGNKRDIRIENLELVTRAELMRRNTYHRYGKEVAQLVQLRGAINRQINKREGKKG
jgi:hypothetical protein